MGVEIALYALPADWCVLKKVLSNEIRGDVLQNIKGLFSDLRDGERGEEWLEDYRDCMPENTHTPLEDAFELVKQNPHLLGIYFDGSSRGHDYWAYLFELAAENEKEIGIARAAVFASQLVGPTAMGSQGIPIKWSDPSQVSEIHQFISAADNREKIEQRFSGFPSDRVFYKQLSDEFAPALMGQLGQIRSFYEKVTRYNLSVISILD